EPALNYVEFTMEGAHHLMSQALVTADVTHPEIANLGWAVVFHQERQEILAPIAAQNRTMVLVTIAIAGAVATAAVGVSRQLAGPVTRLTAVARKVAEGDLTAQAHVESGDEIGVLAVAFNNMTTQLRQTLDGLEQRVAERTHDLEQRSVYLEAAAEVSYAATSIRDLDKLLTRVTHLLSERFDFYHTGVFLLDGEGEYAVLRAASGPGGQRMLERGHQFEVGETSVVGYVTWAKEPRIAFDAGQDAVLFDNPDLPETRSEMVLPLVSGGQVLGALDIQSTEGSAFTQEDVSILQVLADQLAIAIDNAKLFAENQAALAESQAALETARRAYQGVSREGWQDLLRGRPDLGYLASTKKVAPSSQTQFTPEMAQASIKGRTIVGDAATVAVPIKIQDQTTGVVRFRKPETNGWTKSEINLLESLTDRLGTALESARLYKDTQTALVRTNALYQVGRAAITTEHIPQLLQSVANSVAESIAADEALVIALDVESQTVLHFHKNGAPTQLPTPDLFDQLMSGLTGWAIQKKQALLSPKELPDPRESQAAQQYRRDNQVGSVVIAPMTYRQKILGTITATNKMDRPDFTQADADLLAAMANQVAAALTNAELLSQTRTRALQLQTSAEVAQASSSILELDQLLPTAVEVIGERFSFYYVGIFLVDETGRWAELRAGTGKAGQVQIEQGHRLRVGGESMIGQCISTARARIAFDVGEEAVHFQNPNLPETRSEMALPLTSRGRTIGAITIQATQPTAFNQENITVFQTMAGQLAIAIRNAQLFVTEQRRSQNAATLLE
ncbi:MAG: GAF domain-containing protein, partial [Anaerolineales bacterium]